MRIERLILENAESPGRCDAAFSPGPVLLRKAEAKAILDAAALLCGSTAPPGYLPARAGARLTAAVAAAGRCRHVCAAGEQGNWKLTARQENGRDCTADYLAAVHRCAEEADFDLFDGDAGSDFHDRFLRYKNSGFCYPENTFVQRTEGIGETRTFKLLLDRTIRSFPPQKLSLSGREMFFSLNDTGRFALSAAQPARLGTGALTGEENKIFQFLCFLQISEFWQRLGVIRDLTRVDKPLLVTGLLEGSDGDAQRTVLLQEAQKSGRQIFWVCGER